jgi:transglutaminase/protease-like cytokinesis protein 3
VDVKGHSKSVGYEPGMRIAEGKFTNTWNAVVIDGEWRFVQCNWGARFVFPNFFAKL